MCDIFKDRIKINRILEDATEAGGDLYFTSLDELSGRCFAALQAAYHGACLDECLETAARDFATRRLARIDRAELSPQRLAKAA